MKGNTFKWKKMNKHVYGNIGTVNARKWREIVWNDRKLMEMDGNEKKYDEK